MFCPRCRRVNDYQADLCICGYRFGQIEGNELQNWYDEYQQIIEAAFLPAVTPWEQSGKSGAFEEWIRLRIPISECIETSGAFLDIGCANGFLLECLLEWTQKKGVAITPYGLDMSPKLVELAQARLPQFRGNMFPGNALDWEPPLKFRYVRTSVEYVPRNLQKAYLDRLLTDFLVEDGRLLVAQYRSRREDLSRDWIDEYLTNLGFDVESYSSGVNRDGKELCRVAVIGVNDAAARAIAGIRRSGSSTSPPNRLG